MARPVDKIAKCVTVALKRIARPSCFASRREIRELRETIAKPRDNTHFRRFVTEAVFHEVSSDRLQVAGSGPSVRVSIYSGDAKTN